MLFDEFGLIGYRTKEKESRIDRKIELNEKYECFLFICVVVMILNVNVDLTCDVCVCHIVSSWNDRVYDIRDYHHGPLPLVDPSVWHRF